jgi:hypothetical protein
MMANPDDQYDAEAVRRRVAQQFGISQESQQPSADESSTQATTNHAQVVENLRQSEIERAAEKEKNKQSEPGAPEAVAGVAALIGQQIGQRVGVPSSDYFNAKSFHNEISNKLSAAQQAAMDASQHANDWKEHHDWLHSEHAMNEHLPEEFQFQNQPEPIVPSDIEKTGRERQTGYNTRSAQEAARTRQIEKLAQSLGLSTEEYLAKFPDVDSSGEGIVLSKAEKNAQNAQEVARLNAQTQARNKANQILEPQKQNAKEQLKLAQDRANKLQIEAEELAADKAAARAATMNAEAKMSPALRASANTMGQGSKYFPSWVNQAVKTATPYAAKASKVLGPVGAALSPFQIIEGINELKRGEYGRGLAHTAGGVGGLMALAPLAAGAGLIAPELAIGAAGAGALASLPSLGYDVNDMYEKYFQGQK